MGYLQARREGCTMAAWRPAGRRSATPPISYSGRPDGGGGCTHKLGGWASILSRAGAVNMAGGPCPPLVVWNEWMQAEQGWAQASDRQPWIWSTHCWADGTSWAQKL